MPEEDLVDIKFRLYDGSDIGPFSYSSASTVDMLKQRVVSDWPKGKTMIPKTSNEVKLMCFGKILENSKTVGQIHILAPNILGFSFGAAQMILYAIYQNNKTVIVDKEKLLEHKTADDIVKQINITVLPTSEVQVQVKEEAVSPACANNSDKSYDDHGQNERDQREHVPQPCHVDAQTADDIVKQINVTVLPTSEVQVQVKEEAVSPACANNSNESYDDHGQNERDQCELVPQC